MAKGSLVTQEDLDLLLDDYYGTRGWTPQGVPKKKKLEELGLEEYDGITASKKRGEVK